MSSSTPFFCITVSSSFFTSSKVKPYWKPEQPPPVTNTRSLSPWLPSSSISCLTLLAALSEKTSGSGISVTAFMYCSFACLLRDLQFDRLHLCRVVHQAPFDHRALLDLDALVMDITFDPRIGLEFERLARVDRAVDGAVHHHVPGLDFAVDARMLGHHQRAGLIGQRRDIAAHCAVDTQAAAEEDIAFDARGGADQAVDAVLRLAFLAEHGQFSFNPASRCGSPSVRRCPLRRRAVARCSPWPWDSPGTSRPPFGSA